MKRKVVKLINRISGTEYTEGYLHQVHIKDSYNMWLLEICDPTEKIVGSMLLIDLKVNTDAKKLEDLIEDSASSQMITFNNKMTKITDVCSTCHFDYYSSDFKGSDGMYVVQCLMPNHNENTKPRWNRYEMKFNKFEVCTEEE